jgi:hypothetical protein
MLRLSGNKNISSDSKYSAVIVETSVNPFVEFAVRNVVHFLGPQWALQVVCSDQNEKYLRYILGDLPNIQFKPLLSDTIKYLNYNSVLKTAEFWKSTGASRVLLFDADAFMIRGGMDYFLRYDMAGALSEDYPLEAGKKRRLLPDTRGYIGASLRSVPAMIAAIERYGASSPVSEREDAFFARHLSAMGYKVASGADARIFCAKVHSEKQKKKRKPREPFIIHAPWLWTNHKSLKKYQHMIWPKNVARATV